MKNKISIISIFCIICMEAFAQISKDSIQALFPTGNFVSFKDNIACYRLKGVKGGGMYGYCKYDPSFDPDISSHMSTWEEGKGQNSKILNSKCYTFIGPIFDYALPFNDGWAPVCINKKWNYVSLDGQYLCGFLLDAAYPFKDGKAKVVFEGNPYEINCYGEGLPNATLVDTEDLSIELKANTIQQLYNEGQYNRAIEEGQKAYNSLATIQNGTLPELTEKNLTSAIKIAFGIMASQNSMMSLSARHFQNIFNKYRTLGINRFVSFESRHPAINRANAAPYFAAFIEKYGHQSNNISVEIDRHDYKSAILIFERWLKDNDVAFKEDFALLMTYYYLAELSDDFETANSLLGSISAYYEKSGAKLRLTEEQLCVMLADIKKCRSAETLFGKLIEQAKKRKDESKLFWLYYNLAMMYKSVGYEQKSIECLKNALGYRMPKEMEDLRLECMVDLIHSQLKNNTCNEQLLKEYVNSEIELSTTLFENQNTIVLNRLWGNSLQRIERVLAFLSFSNDQSYLRSAFALALFQQSIAFEAERSLTKSILALEDVEIQNQYDLFKKKKSDLKGMDVFDFISITDSLRNSIYDVYEKEESIKNLLIKRKGSHISRDLFKRADSCHLNIIDILQYRLSDNVYRYGAFVKTTNGHITFIPLSICDEFSRDDFWKRINLAKNFMPQDDIYVYYGALDTLGLEYIKIDHQIPFCEYRLHRLNSPSHAISTSNTLNVKNVVLYGGLDYGEKFVSRDRGASKGYLENSSVEIEEIEEILASAAMRVQCYTDDEGTIESFQNLSGKSPEILHLATHGYRTVRHHHYNLLENRFNYYRQNTDIQQREWLMNNSGLLMSLDNNDENILYANKIASADLSNAQLVVLSACSTISGESSDGNMQSIGLTTAFLLASAKNIITSLRNVDDKKTCEFMVSFYKFLKDSNNIYEAFRNTVTAMKQKYPQDPDYWSSFVLVEN